MDLLSPYHPVIGHKLLLRGRGSLVKSPTMEGNFLEETQGELTAANMPSCWRMEVLFLKNLKGDQSMKARLGEYLLILGFP